MHTSKSSFSIGPQETKTEKEPIPGQSKGVQTRNKVLKRWYIIKVPHDSWFLILTSIVLRLTIGIPEKKTSGGKKRKKTYQQFDEWSLEILLCRKLKISFWASFKSSSSNSKLLLEKLFTDFSQEGLLKILVWHSIEAPNGTQRTYSSILRIQKKN